MCLHQSAVTFSDLSRNVRSAGAGYDMALFFFIIIICKLYQTHMENSPISHTQSRFFTKTGKRSLKAISTRLKRGRFD